MRGEEVPQYTAESLGIEPHSADVMPPEREEEIQRQMLELDKKYAVDPREAEESAYRDSRLEEQARMNALQQIRAQSEEAQFSGFEDEEDENVIKPQGF
jgi:hypothetical protein